MLAVNHLLILPNGTLILFKFPKKKNPPSHVTQRKVTLSTFLGKHPDQLNVSGDPFPPPWLV